MSVISFQAASPDPTTYPREHLAEVMSRILADRTFSPFDYDVGPGIPPLREIVAERLAERSGLAIDADNITITHGAAGAIEAAAAAFIHPGDVVFVQDFTYHTGMKSFRGRGADIVACPSDDEGLVVDGVAAAVSRARSEGRRPRLIYCCANFANPLGTTMSASRREAMARLAEREDLLIVQDDTYSQIRFVLPEPPPLNAYAPARTILVGSCSKVLAPTLRLGWTASSPEVAAQLLAVRTDLGVGLITQHAGVALLASPWFDQHLARAVDLYRTKHERMQKSLADLGDVIRSVSQPEGGFYLWVTMAAGSADALAARAPDHGVGLMSQSYFSATGTDGPSFRLGYSQVPIDDLEEGVRRVGQALQP